MARIWRPRSVSGLRSLPGDDLIVDFCTNTNEHRIKGQASIARDQGVALIDTNVPKIPPDQSWLLYDYDVRVFRKANFEVIRRMVEYVPLGQLSNPSGSGNQPTQTGTQPYNMDDDNEHVVNQKGLPETYLIARWRILRIDNEINPPVIVQAAGVAPVELASNAGVSRVVSNFLGHKVYENKGWRIYYVPADVQQAENLMNAQECNQRIVEATGTV